MSRAVIAIDGPAASGKSTVASRIAAELRIPYVNTGNMYRAVTWLIQRAALDLADEAGIRKLLEGTRLEYHLDQNGTFRLLVNGEDPGGELRAPEVAAQVSPVAALPYVREWLKGIQRAAADDGMIVMEGRDIGTEIFPDAKWKFFVTASAEVRARRRLAQSSENFSGATLAQVAAAIAERDRIDSTRTVAPLRPAEDSIRIDSSDLTIEEVVGAIIKQVREQ